MADGEETAKIHRGLKGVYMDRSAATFIDGRAGELRYRGYSIHDLAEHSSFEETAYLLLEGKLPTRAEMAAFDAELKAGRDLPEPIYEVIRRVRGALRPQHRVRERRRRDRGPLERDRDAYVLQPGRSALYHRLVAQC